MLIRMKTRIYATPAVKGLKNVDHFVSLIKHSVIRTIRA